MDDEGTSSWNNSVEDVIHLQLEKHNSIHVGSCWVENFYTESSHTIPKRNDRTRDDAASSDNGSPSSSTQSLSAINHIMSSDKPRIFIVLQSFVKHRKWHPNYFLNL